MTAMVKMVWFQIVQNVLCVKYTLSKEDKTIQSKKFSDPTAVYWVRQKVGVSGEVRKFVRIEIGGGEGEGQQNERVMRVILPLPILSSCTYG